MTIQHMNLCFLLRGSNVLLGEHLRGPFKGYLNGHGGKLDEEEEQEYMHHLLHEKHDLAEKVMRRSMNREVQEETGLTLAELEKIGVQHATFVDKPGVLEVHWYRSNKSHGKLLEETAEMNNRWFPVYPVPFSRMMPMDEFCLPLLLEGNHFIAYNQYQQKNGKLMLSREPRIRKVELIDVVNYNGLVRR